jgi:predicted metal-dependent HD superfamily phosphohydrolase
LASSVGNLTELSRFQALWRRNLVSGAVDNSTAIHQRLLAGYQESNRFYHSLDHIEHCLKMFEQCKSLVAYPDTLEIAIWFHDVILESGRRDNEALSASLYLELSADVQCEEMRSAINSMIMATLHDGTSLNQPDSIYMVDIDLSSFGLPWNEFLRDSLNLRAENPQVCDEEYQLNQTGFQRGLLARPRFYLSDFFYQRFEKQARANLARYFKYLDNCD